MAVRVSVRETRMSGASVVGGACREAEGLFSRNVIRDFYEERNNETGGIE
jgi:hypothetical protein